MASLIGKAFRNATPVPMTGPIRSSIVTTNLMSLGGNAESNLNSYGTQGTVFANVSLLAASAAKPEWKLFEKDKTDGRARFTTNDQGSDQRRERTVHASLNVLNTPATFTVNGRKLVAWSRFSMFEISGMWLELLGKSAWVVDYGKVNFPVGLWPVRPDRISPVPDPENYLKGYIYTAPDSSEKIPLNPNEVIWNRYPNPIDPYDGLGPVQSVRTEIEGIRYAGEWNRNFFLNSARPDGVLSSDHHVEDDEWDEISDRWREAHRGVGRAHRIAVLENVTWVPTSTSVKDMDFVNLRTDARDAIRESMGVHKIMTGLTEDVNRANAQTGEEVFANWKIVPRLDRWRDVLNYQFLPLFYPPGADIPYEFDYIYPLPANREQDNAELLAKANAARFLVQSGYDPNDVLEVVGLPDMNVVEVATQAPALPPSWVAEQAPPSTADTGAPAGNDGSAQNRLAVAAAALTRSGHKQDDIGELLHLLAAAKLAKASVNYRDGGPAEHCGNCAMYQQATGTCTLVAGPIDPAMVCDRWAARVTNGKDTQAKVLAQLALDYPAKAYAWAHHASWAGPVPLPEGHINVDPLHLKTTRPNHVQDFVDRLRAGKKLKPLIAVKTPGSDKPELIDGAHRYMAAMQEGAPVRTWIATVSKEHGPWESMHDQQYEMPGPASAAVLTSRLQKVLANGHQPVEFAELRDA
jgi:phage portal protein BeeE